VPQDQLPLSDRGFRYGWHFFETLTVRAGEVHLWEAHQQKLAASAPDWWSLLETGGVESALSPEMLDGQDGILRLYLTAGDGGPQGAVTDPRWLAVFEPGALEIAGEPLALNWRVVADEALYPAGVKSGNYLRRIEWMQQARGEGMQETLLIAAPGRVLSCIMANAAFRLDGRWLTPPTGGLVRSGVVREWLLARKLIYETCMELKDLSRMEAMVVMNSRRGMAAVGSLAGRLLEIDPVVDDWNAAFWLSS